MLIALDPQQKFDLVLDYYQRLPEGQQPALVCRYLSYRAQRAYVLALAEVEKTWRESNGDMDLGELLRPVWEPVVMGWKNFTAADGTPIPFDLAKVGEVLTEEELWEVSFRLKRASELAELELKKSISQSQSDTAAASASVPAAVDAPTNPASKAPSGSPPSSAAIAGEAAVPAA